MWRSSNHIIVQYQAKFSVLKHFSTHLENGQLPTWQIGWLYSFIVECEKAYAGYWCIFNFHISLVKHYPCGHSFLHIRFLGNALIRWLNKGSVLYLHQDKHSTNFWVLRRGHPMKKSRNVTGIYKTSSIIWLSFHHLPPSTHTCSHTLFSTIFNITVNFHK